MFVFAIMMIAFFVVFALFFLVLMAASAGAVVRGLLGGRGGASKRPEASSPGPGRREHPSGSAGRGAGTREADALAGRERVH